MAFGCQCSHASRATENTTAGSIVLTSEEKAEVDNAIAEFEVKGHRYSDAVPAAAMALWG